MSLIDFLKKFSIIIAVVLALILSRSGFDYLLILILIGLIVSFINKRKREAVIAGILYALVGYVLSYPAGLFLKDYMPSTSIPIQTSTATVMSNLLVGALIPVCVAIIICTITAIIGSNIAKALGEKESEEIIPEMNDYQVTLDDYEDQPQEYIEVNHKDELLNYTPIHKSKMRKERQKKQEDENDD